MKRLKYILTFCLLLLIANSSFSQNSLIGTWTFNKISSKDSVLLNTSEKARIKDFIIRQRKIELSKIPLTLADTVNKMIDKEVILLCNSFIKFNNDSSFEITRSEILIPRAIPGIVKDSTINGIWHYEEHTQIVTFETNDNFRFLYKIIKVGKEKLKAGIIYKESQYPKFISEFIRN